MAGSVMIFKEQNQFFSTHLCWQAHKKLNWQKIQQHDILEHQHNKYVLAEYLNAPIKCALFR